MMPQLPDTTAPPSYVPARPANPGDASFPPGLPIELALGLNTAREICTEYGLSRDEFALISKNESFVAQFDWAMEERERPGGIVRLQCMMMANEAIRTMHSAMTDVENNINQRAAHAKDILRFAGVEPEKRKDAVNPGDRLVINITFDKNHPGVTIDG